MEGIASIAELIAVIEVGYADMAYRSIGIVRETYDGWTWETDGKTYTYVRDIFSGEDEADMGDVRMLSELEEHEDGGVSSKRYIFDDSGLLSILRVQLDPEQAANNDVGELIESIESLEVDVFGAPEVSDEDQLDLLNLLMGALAE